MDLRSILDRISVSTILKLSMTCVFSHCLVLAVTHHTQGIGEMLKIKELMSSIGKDFRLSYQKIMEYRMIFQSLHEDIVEFELCPATHWMYLRKTGCKLIKIIYKFVIFYKNRAERHQAHSEEEDETAPG